MKLKKLLAVILTLAVCISFIPLNAAYVSAAEEASQPDVTVQEGSDTTSAVQAGDSTQAEATAQQNTATVYSGSLPSLPSPAGQVIAQTAINLAWPYGTSTAKYSYSGGSARDNFQIAIDKVFPNRSGWGAKPKVGASCDVFVATVVRYAGYDSSVPRGVDPAFSYYPAHPEKWTNTGICKVKDMQPGDVIIWKKPSGTKHTCIYVEINGVGYIAEAHYTSGKYGCVDRKATDYDPSNYTYFAVYRANQPFTGNIDKGCTGANVESLQNFLNWAGYDCGSPDGSFGSKTYSALKAWQTDAGLTVDGRFGKASLAAAATFIPGKTSVRYAPKPAYVAKAYSGAFPTKSLKKGSRGTQVKNLQKFLNWYGIKVTVDGKYGNGLKKAVKKFQKANGLKQDGKFGSKSLKKAKSIKR